MSCRLACAVIIAAVWIAGAHAQDSVAQFYKGRQITVIVGSSAGGGYDIYARLLARHMPRHIPGNPAMMVSNMTGAGSNAAAAHVYNVAPRDGTVIGALQNSAVLESLLDALLGDTKRLRHDATKFVHLGSATIDHYVCIARADAEVKSFRDLLTQELIIGASQPGTSTRDFPALLNSMAGITLVPVPYPGSAQGVNDVLAGRVPVMFSSIATVWPHVKSGKLKASATTQLERLAIAPDLPTMTEAGLPGYDAVVWMGLLAPAGTPREVVNKLARAANGALRSSDVLAPLRAQGFEPIGGSPDEFGRYIDDELRKWSNVAIAAELKK